MTEKLIIDRRVACIALRFKNIAETERNGLDPFMSSVIYYSELTRNENLTPENEMMNNMIIKKINNLKKLLEEKYI